MELNCNFPLILTGFLLVKSQNGFSIKQNPKKKRLVQLFARSSQGIERLEISDSETDKNSRIVTLENCIKIISEPQEGNCIKVITKSGQIVFQCSSETEANTWTKQLQSVAFNDKLGTQFKRNSIVEYNELYCSSFSEGKFTVNLIQTDITVKNNMDPKMYTLELTTTEIQLKNYDDESIIVAKWPYRYIRKYGYRDGKFTFEAGRKCDTGEGTFKLDHASPQEIFRCMSSKMKSMKKLINSDSSGSLDNSDNQLNIALSMEAGSRSPLPPINSPTSPDTEISHASLRGFLSSTDSINLSFLSGPATSRTVGNAPISIPSKPPRKTIHITNSNDRINNNFHEQLVQLDSPPTPPERNKSMGNRSRDYECILGIQDAWKTLGISDVKHTEHVSTPDDELQEFVWQRSKSFNRNESRKITIVDINENTHKMDDESDYDRLEFFPTKNTTKPNSNYKTIVPIIPPKEKKNVQVSDDYEIITPTELQPSSSTSQEVKDLAPSRLADDSYLGYGVIRKNSSGVSTTTIPFTSGANSQTVGIIDHQKIPSNDYAIVSKPKRV